MPIFRGWAASAAVTSVCQVLQTTESVDRISMLRASIAPPRMSSHFLYNFASNSAATVYFLMHCLSVASLHLEGAASRKSFSMICLPCLLVMLAIVRQLEVQFLLVSIHPLSQLQACAIACSGFFAALHSLPLLAAFFSQSTSAGI